jgi:ribosomal protein L37E
MITPSRRDHSTRVSLSEANIKKSADKVRAALDSRHRADFNIVEAIERLSQREFFKWGKLQIEKFRAPDGKDLTFVRLTPTGKTLCVDEELWDDARLGEPKARYMLAHEVGHLVLHDCYVQPYSDEKKSIYDEGSSTEWQAHTFARFFLLNDRNLEPGLTPHQIAMNCSVEVGIVRRRLGGRVTPSNSLCQRCGSEKVFWVDEVKTCEACGWRAEYIQAVAVRGFLT